MDPGKLNRKINLIKYVEVENEIGELEQKLNSYKKIWARIEPTKGKEYLENKKIQAEQMYKLTVRYREDITTDMLIKYKDKLLNINAIIDPYMAHERLELMCTEKVNSK